MYYKGICFLGKLRSNDNLWILINMYVIFLELELIYIKYGDGDVFN
jgi:hypothetical protein